MGSERKSKREREKKIVLNQVPALSKELSLGSPRSQSFPKLQESLEKVSESPRESSSQKVPVCLKSGLFRLAPRIC